MLFGEAYVSLHREYTYAGSGVQVGDGIGHGRTPDQTKVNIREWASRRKQKPVRRPESRSERLRGLERRSHSESPAKYSRIPTIISFAPGHSAATCSTFPRSPAWPVCSRTSASMCSTLQ